ncbi:type VI secretion system-associated FHA domain protein TagH [Salipiger sp. 1_MG-2023]|uniref:type VI secretion system-associated FHA domain protein TagH n=1 Tax=Salipiger sp. 1_MG-2023 TaxID=3062665 RepID=UPI0026E2E747|nr:type VI secretion system-associated FHA domain protein TagH [Salipiger sp. 1_MG-2023]MDO6584920.1 type VI secretion system-associated FHA domain protein TagH [Salipiger sp. 1_MG-2023]
MKLVLEHSPRPQARTEMVFEGNRLSIGRSEDCDWQLDDPEMFISRRHLILSEQGGQVMVTDASSGGLYIDNAANPLGPGNSVPVEPGMKLRLGDFTLRIEASPDTPRQTIAPAMTPAAPPRPGGFDFGAHEAAPPPPERPATLPDPFGLKDSGAALNWQKEPPAPPRPLDQSDPFELDLQGSPGETAPRARSMERTGGDAFFGSAPEPAAPDRATPDDPPAKPDLFAGLSASFEPEPAPEVTPPAPDPEEQPILSASFGFGTPSEPVPEPPAEPAPNPTPAPPPAANPVTPRAAPSENDPIEALFRGLGVQGSGSPEELEQIGRSMRALTEGLMILLRHRAQERARVRVAQTVIASQNVNPLKFLASTEEGLESLMAPRGRGYLDPDPALAEAFRDLHDHQMRTWAAMQTALRRMLGKFDPAEIAREMEDVGRLESLLAGGRSAKLWQLYEERFREIARAAEEQFLGEVGVDFRDAYENRKE